MLDHLFLLCNHLERGNARQFFIWCFRVDRGSYVIYMLKPVLNHLERGNARQFIIWCFFQFDRDSYVIYMLKPS